MNSELKAFSGCIDGNSATLKMTNGATNPTITTPSTVLSDTLLINSPPDALHFDAAGTVKLTFADGSIATRKVLAGTTYYWKVKQIWVTSLVGITAADIGLLYSAKRLAADKVFWCQDFDAIYVTAGSHIVSTPATWQPEGKVSPKSSHLLVSLGASCRSVDVPLSWMYLLKDAMLRGPAAYDEVSPMAAAVNKPADA